ncbi:hypothetical protein AV530_002562 [Patagioenas fasciata monilis]|uniref:Uncharacterized protein n=1 Tax=Patagioenas fasciata monilis TaxID=372326 RepID=A0A1V4K6W7_PATFA|nr:hypothetical protein AV530_002562 [Patagioenas fasciata monilis]
MFRCGKNLRRKRIESHKGQLDIALGRTEPYFWLPLANCLLIDTAADGPGRICVCSSSHQPNSWLLLDRIKEERPLRSRIGY